MKNSNLSRRKFMASLGIAAAALPVAKSFAAGNSGTSTGNSGPAAGPLLAARSPRHAKRYWRNVAKQWKTLTDTSLKGKLPSGMAAAIHRKLLA